MPLWNRITLISFLTKSLFSAPENYLFSILHFSCFVRRSVSCFYLPENHLTNNCLKLAAFLCANPVLLFPGPDNFQCCIVAFLMLTESKLKNWTVKYGREEKVQQIMNQYKTFVSKNKIFQEFQKAFVEFKEVCTEYKRDGAIGIKTNQSYAIHLHKVIFFFFFSFRLPGSRSD